jgi:2-iminobutanoate/2-iminopropanoate deaminase
MKKRVFNVPGATSPDLPFSSSVAYGSLLFTSGQVGKDESGKLIEGDFAAQVHQTLKNVQVVLENAGSTMECVLKSSVFLADMDNFSEFNEIYKEYFKGDYPARTTFQVGRFGPGVLIEIDVIAYIPETE